MLKFKPGTVEKNLSSTVDRPAGIEPTPLHCFDTSVASDPCAKHQHCKGLIRDGGPVVDE